MSTIVGTPGYTTSLVKPSFGTSGNAWLGSYTFLGATSSSYFVVTQDGEWLGTVDFPESFTPLQFGSDVLLGVETGQFDVPAVAVYRIEKGNDD